MASAKTVVDKAKREAQGVVDNPWVERMVRIGYVARGILYIMLGLIAASVALGTRSAAKDPTGAIAELGAQPYGKFLLVVMALGLIGYSAWGFIRAIWDPLNKGTDAKGLVARAGFLWSAFAYGILALPTVQFLQGKPATTQNQTAQTQDLSARLLQAPMGKWILLAIGIAVIIGGLYQVYFGYKREFAKDLHLQGLNKAQKERFLRIGEYGYAARGVVFALIGVFMAQAALTLDPKKAQGLDGALSSLAHQAYGPLLLGLIALGLIAFGVFSVVAGRYARVDLS